MEWPLRGEEAPSDNALLGILLAVAASTPRKE
jgi:hypothetical protein